MEEGRKRPLCDASEQVSGSTAYGDDEDDVMAWLAIDDDSVEELMELLQPEVTSPIKVKFIDNPYVSTLVFQSSASYVTINGNEESCGSSFSDSEASIMANIDMGSARVRPISSWAWEFPTGSCGGGLDLDDSAWAENGGGFNGWDGFDWDEDLLAKFLGEDLLGETL